MYHLCCHVAYQVNKKVVNLHSAFLSTVGFLGPSIMHYTKNTGYGAEFVHSV